jgi:segregation and condensation protein B
MTMDNEQRRDVTVADRADETGTADVATVDSVLEGSLPGGPAAEMNEQLIAIVEALVFASPEPITLKALSKLLDPEPKTAVQAALGELRRRYDERPGGLQLVEVANGYQIVTRPELHDWVRRMFHERTTQKLSVQALETLAVIAYKQPITAAEITEIRGVNTSGVIGTLLERGLVKISGRKQVVGRPFLYSTTRTIYRRSRTWPTPSVSRCPRGSPPGPRRPATNPPPQRMRRWSPGRWGSQKMCNAQC